MFPDFLYCHPQYAVPSSSLISFIVFLEKLRWFWVMTSRDTKKDRMCVSCTLSKREENFPLTSQQASWPRHWFKSYLVLLSTSITWASWEEHSLNPSHYPHPSTGWLCTPTRSGSVFCQPGRMKQLCLLYLLPHTQQHCSIS